MCVRERSSPGICVKDEASVIRAQGERCEGSGIKVQDETRFRDYGSGLACWGEVSWITFTMKGGNFTVRLGLGIVQGLPTVELEEEDLNSFMLWS